LAITGGSRPAARELLTMLIGDGESLVAEITAAVASRNAAAVREAAHALKGIAGNVGAPRLERAARAIETCPAATSDAGLTTFVAALKEEFTTVAVRGRAFAETP
ncbi:MAG TPA: Hpt domain-containing protein, partial [Xanthomonadales bacterium]|nr:Hpt domain-containing protein [Xanthomonadales bacterium]